jgi:carbonic anhydrase
MPTEINDLKNGYKKFKQMYFEGDNDFYKNLVEQGQQPKYLIVACSDSRVDPSLILNCKPGDLFVIRNVANLIPPYEIDTHYHGTSAALEFGICGLGIKEIIILGHSQCGGILSLLAEDKDKKTGNFISKWMELAQISCELSVGNNPNLSTTEKANICGRSALLGSLENLETFPWIAERLKSGELFIHAWYFDLETGNISAYNKLENKFEALI